MPVSLSNCQERPFPDAAGEADETADAFAAVAARTDATCTVPW
jgi:hypothetical protein